MSFCLRHRRPIPGRSLAKRGAYHYTASLGGLQSFLEHLVLPMQGRDTLGQLPYLLLRLPLPFLS